MKKSVKILTVTAAVLTVVGVIVFLVGMGMLGWNFNRLDVTEYTAKRYAATATERVERVELDLKTFPVVVTAGEDTALDYYEATDTDISVTYESGTLKVVEKYTYNPFKVGMFSGLDRKNHKFVLTLPEHSDLVVKGANCDIRASDLAFADVDMNVTNLYISLDGCSVDSMSLKSVNLDLELIGCKLGSLFADATNADVTLNGCESGKAEIHSTNSDIDISGGAYVEITAEATNNGVDIGRVSVQTIVLSGVNGDYTLERVSVDNLSVDAINLEASLEIVGARSEYTVETDGRNLPREQTGTTDKRIYLEGNNCDVELKFV